MFQCEFCKKEYKTISSLNYHQKTTKFCINIQKEKSSVTTHHNDQIVSNMQNMDTNSCDNINYKCYCNKTFLRKHIYDKHLKKCPDYKIHLQLEELTKHNTTLQSQIVELTNNNFSLVNSNKSLNDELILLRTQVELLQKNNMQLINNLSKSNVTNITNNNNNSSNHITHFNDCFKNLNPFTEQNIQDAVLRLLSANSIIEGEERYMSDFIQAIKPMIMVTDPTRNRVCVKTDNGKKQRSDSTSVIRNVYKHTKKEHENIIHNAMDIGPAYNIENLKKWCEISNVIEGIRNAIHDSTKNKKNKLVDKIATRLNKEYVKEESTTQNSDC